MEGIVLKQAPVISHQLKIIGKSVTDRLAELHLNSLVATDDTIKSLKSIRADLNKELKEYEQQRKAIKDGVNKPYLEFEALYKEEVSDKFKNGIDTLKTKINTFEMAVKDQKKETIQNYFTELCTSEKIDYLTFDQLGLEINLSTTEKAYKDKVNEFVNRVKDDVLLIETEEFAPEIFVEYKKTLNAAQSITTVRKRKQAEAEELERIKQKQIIDRKKALVSLGFKEVSFTNSYNYSDTIYFTNAEIADLSRDEFKEKYLKFEAEINEIKKAERERLQAEAKAKANAEIDKKQVTPPTLAQEPIKAQTPEPIKEEKPAPEVLQAPTPEFEPKVVASFEVSGTMEQMNALRDFLISNNIEYQNI